MARSCRRPRVTCGRRARGFWPGSAWWLGEPAGGWAGRRWRLWGFGGWLRWPEPLDVRADEHGQPTAGEPRSRLAHPDGQREPEPRRVHLEVGEPDRCVVAPAEQDSQPDTRGELVLRRGHPTAPLLELLGRRRFSG